jgi:hypothetical protein
MLAKAPMARFGSLEELRRALDALEIAPGAAVAPDVPLMPAAEEPHRPRYAASGPLGETDHSTLFHATDTRLGREVVIERFRPGFLESERGRRHLAWLRTMARFGAPHLQRVLSIAPPSAAAEASRGPDGSAVYEAVVGPRVAAPLREQARAAVLRALAPIHALGVAHGSVAASLLIDELGPTLLVAGRGPSGAPADDVAELDRLATR